jgi:hypothetical protein
LDFFSNRRLRLASLAAFQAGSNLDAFDRIADDFMRTVHCSKNDSTQNNQGHLVVLGGRRAESPFYFCDLSTSDAPVVVSAAIFL